MRIVGSTDCTLPENIITKTETAEKDSLEIETIAGEDTERNSHVDAEEIGNFRMELKAKENARPENEPDVEEEVSLEHEVELETIFPEGPQNVKSDLFENVKS